jgi:tRNA(Ile)-lysidine synthase
VAVSGGADSVALLRALATICRSHRHSPHNKNKNTLVVAHFHHGWRGSSADADQQFVESLAAHEDLEFATARNSDLTQAGGIGTEARARQQRYAFLQATAEHYGARYVLTAHTANDQVETVLHRLLRGTGIEGLTGIPRIRRLSPDVALVRPLLHCTRAEIESYLADLGQGFRTDESNFDARFTRNKIRHQLLPLLRSKFHPHLDAAILRLAEDACEHVQAVRHELSMHYDRMVLKLEDRLQLERVVFQQLTPLQQRLLLREVWRRNQWPQRNMSRQRWQELAQFLALAQNTQRHFPGGVLVTVEDEIAWLSQAGLLSRNPADSP